MRWIKPNLRGSIYSLLGAGPAPVSESLIEDRIEDIRHAMLKAIGPAGDRYTALTRRVRFAGDVQALWYLRGELMAALCAAHGELEARGKVSEISMMFDGMLPAAMTAKTSRFAG